MNRAKSAKFRLIENADIAPDRFAFSVCKLEFPLGPLHHSGALLLARFLDRLGSLANVITLPRRDCTTKKSDFRTGFSAA